MDLTSSEVGFLGDQRLQLSQPVEEYLGEKIPDSPLHQLWRCRYTEGNVVVLDWDTATQIAESHEEGYHCGLWHLATQYEKFMAMALLTNSNPDAPGFGGPKCFSGWGRRHDTYWYRRAKHYRARLNEHVADTEPEQRRRYRPN